MKITLVMNNFTYDITHLVDTNNLSRSVEMKHTIDGQFNTASIYLPQVTKDELGTNIDLSRGIIRNSLVNIEHDGNVFQWRIMADTVTNKLNNTYSHDIALLDRRSELTGITLPDISLTQKSFVSNEKVRAVITPTKADKINLESGILKLRPFDDYETCLCFTIFPYKKQDDRNRILQVQVPLTEDESKDIDLKVLANINTFGCKETVTTDDFTLKGSNKTTNNEMVIDFNANNNIILKNKNNLYTINGTIKVFDSTPAVTLSGNSYENLFSTDNLFYTSDVDKIIIVEAVNNGSVVYYQEFKVNPSTISSDYSSGSGPFSGRTFDNTTNFPLTNINFNFNYTPTTDNEEIILKARVKRTPWQTRLKNVVDKGYHHINDYGWADCPDGLPPISEFNTIAMQTSFENWAYLGETMYTQKIGFSNNKYYYKNLTYSSDRTNWLELNNLAEMPTYLAITDYSVVVETTATSVTGEIKSLEWWVNHALSSIYIGEIPLYTIEESTRARLSQIEAPEFTAKNYTLYQLINEVAEYLGGVDWEITADNKIKFIFFDELPIQDISEDSDVQALDGTSDLNGYQSSVQINAENITLRSIIEEGWSSPRSADVGNMQLIDDDLMIPTNYPINFINKVEMKGINYNIAGYNATKPLNITPRIVEYEEWKTLPSQFSSATTTSPSYSRRYFTKTNTLYYKRGEPGIYGLGYCGGVEPGFWTTAVGNRALFETGAVQILTENNYGSSYNTAVTDTGTAMTNAYRLKIWYYPFAASKAIIYKDDISGFQLERNAFMNEDAQVNDPNLLGSVAKSRVNRLGGTEYTKSGYVSSLNDLPQLGSANEAGQRLTQLITQINDANIKYFATYVNDYNKISTFVGKKSDYRLYEVPNKNIVNSTRVKRARFAIGPISSVMINGHFNTKYNKIFENMTYTKNTEPPRNKAPNLVKAITVDPKDPIDPNKTNKVYIPIISGNIGTTAFWKLQAKDNYSVGTVVKEYSIGGKTVRVQEDVGYGNKYGEFDKISSLAFINGEVRENFSNIYPNASRYEPVTTTTSLFTDRDVPYQKDSRETLSLEYQFSFHSTDTDSVMIFNGITKFNAFLTGKTDYNIVAVPCYYRPNKEDIKVDLSKCDPEDNLNSIKFNDYTTTGLPGTKRLLARARFSKAAATVKSAIVYYDSNTLELIMWVKNPTPSVPNTYKTVTTYIRMLAQPTLYSLTIHSMYDKEIPVQKISAYTTYKQVDQLLTPYKVREGYTYGGMYFDSEFTQQVSLNQYILDDIEIFIKWTPIAGTNTWQETNDAIYDEEINPVYDDIFEPPTNYAENLPSAASYSKGYVVRVRPIIRVAFGGFNLPEYDGNFDYAISKYYKVV